VFGYVLTKGLPFVMSALSAVSYYLTPIPIPYLFVVITVVFAATAFGLVGFSLWIRETTARDKLYLSGLEFTWEDIKDELGNTTGIRSAMITLRMQNKAAFPLSFGINKFDLSLENRIPSTKVPKITAEIQPNGGTNWYRSGAVILDISPCRNLKGKLDLEVRYGRPGDERYIVTASGILSVFYNKKENRYILENAQDTETGLTS
jgi:hypothetical protein